MMHVALVSIKYSRSSWLTGGYVATSCKINMSCIWLDYFRTTSLRAHICIYILHMFYFSLLIYIYILLSKPSKKEKHNPTELNYLKPYPDLHGLYQPLRPTFFRCCAHFSRGCKESHGDGCGVKEENQWIPMAPICWVPSGDLT